MSPIEGASCNGGAAGEAEKAGETGKTEETGKARKTKKDRDWSGYTVLIVEDDIVNSKVLGGMLRNTKVNIIYSDNGVKAIEQVQLNPHIDMVLMDMHLPVMNGLEATCKIHDINPALPVIAQTTKDKERCLESGCVDYIGKPLNMGELLNKMSKFLPEK